jgi:hemolysin activation/secretion protein
MRYEESTRAALLRAVALACSAFGAIAPAAAQDAADSPKPAADEAAPVAEAPAETFDVWEFRVLGSKVLDAKAVQRAVYGYLGPHKTIADVEQARLALETAYRNAGFSTVFVDIPEQTVDTGIVRLNVTEGRLDRLRVTGARYFSNRQILARLPSLESGQVPHFPDVQKDLAALNRMTPDRSVTPVLRAGRFPGTVDIELKVKDDLPFHGSVDVNDRYTADTSKLRSSVTLGYDNLWQKEHTFSLQYQTAPQERNEARVVAATYIARLERAKTILALYAVDSSSDVATIGTLSVLGKGKIFGIRGIRPLDNIGRFFQNLTFGIDAKHFDENIRLTVDNALQTPIKYVNWSASYGFGWTLPKSASEFSVGASWGLRGFGNDDEEFENKRFKARGNYGYLMGSGSHTRQVFGDARFVTRFGWQLAGTPLISNEQFSAGGAMSVRGYLEAERLGDLGANLSLELHSPSLVKSDHISDLHFLGFIDAASLRIEDALPGQESVNRLESAGVGFRFEGYHGLKADLDWARVLRDGAHVLEGEDRVHFRVNYGF